MRIMLCMYIGKYTYKHNKIMLPFILLIPLWLFKLMFPIPPCIGCIMGVCCWGCIGCTGLVILLFKLNKSFWDELLLFVFVGWMVAAWNKKNKRFSNNYNKNNDKDDSDVTIKNDNNNNNNNNNNNININSNTKWRFWNMNKELFWTWMMIKIYN